ncbi:Dihydrolipoamide dehydrogenase [Granulibacter bethesdensis]|uniref:dihydrolipoyl dehydrogenase n=1 Tax=Granulibacter bethesdensis TaxID=364410 RepID=UPI0009097528|nr:dihydrolipoyl dehydrogenase [Granulibacter bethesdensis]APH57895.1 Dihydrolipoamide dehydrogenase [Granulibacter bethesdensis]
MSDAFDLIVIGAGPGGYVCAVRAAQLGLKVACVEKRETLGGTCLNIGCIPSKALLQSSENYHALLHQFAEHGIQAKDVALDLDRMQARKAEVVSANVKGIEFLFRKNGVTWLKGAARISAPGKVEVGGQSYEGRHIVIATGSESVPLPGVPVDEVRIVTSTGALALPSVPKHLVVIGGGVIGLELGSVWRRLGAEVTVIEYLDRIVPGMDQEVAKAFQRILEKQGLAFRLGTKVTGAQVDEGGVTLSLEPAKGGEADTLHADIVLVAIGRRPYLDGLGLDEIGVACDERGRVRTDAHFATNIDGLYAIGDAIAGPMLAHKAEDEGVALAEMLAGQAGHVNYDVIPAVVYTWPEVASLGRTEEELKAAGIDYKVGKFPFTANGRARAMGDTDGFVKILADARTDRLLGAHILGPDAGTLIAELATAMEFGASSEDVARICHAHPSLSEAVKEAALAVDGRAIHI